MVGWRSVRAFLSSTFRRRARGARSSGQGDVSALRKRLLSHWLEMYDIDPRWGITEDEAQDERVVRLCLEQVDECPH